MTPIISASVSLHTYNFWTSSTATYVEANTIKTIKNTYTTHKSIKNSIGNDNAKK